MTNEAWPAVRQATAGRQGQRRRREGSIGGQGGEGREGCGSACLPGVLGAAVEMRAACRCRAPALAGPLASLMMPTIPTARPPVTVMLMAPTTQLKVMRTRQ